MLLGSDHRGYELKEAIKQFLDEKGMIYIDKGCYSKVPVDYPDYAGLVACEVSRNQDERGILICYTGIGMSIVANKYPNVRAALCHNLEAAVLSRKHNDANILVMGAKYTDSELAKEMVEAWCRTGFEGRHRERVNKIGGIEQLIREQFHTCFLS